MKMPSSFFIRYACGPLGIMRFLPRMIRQGMFSGVSLRSGWFRTARTGDGEIPGEADYGIRPSYDLDTLRFRCCHVG